MKYDVIIVGGGSSGCTLATRLAENPARSVLLLEAGPDYPDLKHLPDAIKNGWDNSASEVNSPFNWSYQGFGSARQNQPMEIARGKLIGGSGAVNGQVFLRGLPEDYDGWAEQGNDEWSFLNILPFFRKLETDLDIRDDYHGTDGPIPVRRVARDEWLPINEAFYQSVLAAGFPLDPDMNHPDGTGAGPFPLNNLDNVRNSTALTYLNPNRHRLNLTVKANVLAHRVVFDRKRAVGVEVESGRETFTVEAEEVVLCAGGIASPQLLMLSGIGPADSLRDLGIPVIKDLPGVGQNLRDHPLITLDLVPKDGVALAGKIPQIPAGLRYTAKGSATRNDVQVFLGSMAQEGEGDPVRGSSVYGSTGMYIHILLNTAKSAGELNLTSADPATRPRLDFRYLEDEWDLQRLREAIRLSVKLLEHKTFRPLVKELVAPSQDVIESDELLSDWIHQNIATAFHSCGTCKMGPQSDPMAVVDQYCRVREIENLRVVDLSVAPDVVRANTNATAIMIAERAAGWIG